MANANFHVRDKVLFAITLGILIASSLSYFMLQSKDPLRCKTLLQDGFWLNPAELLNWQPAGCMMHTYSPEDATTCLHGRRVIFIGGIEASDLFGTFARKLDPNYEDPDRGWQNISETVTEVDMQFRFDPGLQSFDLEELTRGFKDERERPALAVIGLSLDQLRREKDLSSWTAHVRKILAKIDKVFTDRNSLSDRIVVLPMLEPNVTGLGEYDEKVMSREKASQVNRILSQLGQQSGIDVLHSYTKLARDAGLRNGYVAEQKAVSVVAETLLNLRCNAQLPKHRPFASTCCNTYPRLSWVQVVGFIFVGLLVPLAVFLCYYGFTADTSTFLWFMPHPKYYGAILGMGLTVALCYFCDRTNIFGKEHKQTSPSQFFALGLAVIAASMFTLQTSDKDLAFLNRDQTDEWKGWMQVAILLYHYTGVSKTAYIYNYIRVAPTGYLFMTGFGHTVYFLKKGDYSFRRFVATMLRLNLLNVVLAYAMDNEWLLYYFAPLVTWNFFLIYVMYWLGHKYNDKRSFVYSKMLAAAALNTAFYIIPGVLELAWSILVMLFRMKGDMREWRFRVTLDLYAIFPGMVVGILFLDWNAYTLPKSPIWPFIRVIGIALSAATMLGFAVFEVTQPSKFVYNEKHPYVGWLPCVAFVVLRNATPWLRRTHSALFAWIGRCSLETFILQFHLWLAADTAGLLIIGPPHMRALNALITTILFLWLASVVTAATAPLIEWIMGDEQKPKEEQRTLPMHAKTTVFSESAEALVTDGSSCERDAVESSSAMPMNEISTNTTKEPLSTTQNGTKNKALGMINDLRFRTLVILAAMAFMNWTYYIY